MAPSFRELRKAPVGTGRFFVVRRDTRRIHTWFLEEVGTIARVRGLFHEPEDDDRGLHAGACDRLKLDPEQVSSFLESAWREAPLFETSGGRASPPSGRLLGRRRDLLAACTSIPLYRSVGASSRWGSLIRRLEDVR